jgi:hypothetical protein
MNFDLNETVQHNGRPVSLLNAVREILQLPAVKRFPGSALFRDPGKQPAFFEGAAKSTMKAKSLRLSLGLALALAANAPAEAQYMSSPYPVIIVPPPLVQNPVEPKRAQPPKTTAPTPDSSPNLGRCYQGRTDLCQ